MASTVYEDDAQEAVLADASPRLLVEAPPGSGKTFTAVRLLARDVQGGLVASHQRILVLTFSRHARAQLERYAARLLTSQERKRVEITNYHQFFWRKVWQYRCALGLPLDLTISTDEEHERDVKAAVERAGVRLPSRGGRQVLSDYSRALEFELDEARPARLPQPPEANFEVAGHLRAIHGGGRLHYDDMAYYMWQLLRSERLQALWAHKYPVVALDEYQDASPLQAAVIERIAPPPHRVYAFADPLQMIYRFRDASRDRVPEFQRAGASRHVLRTLHRYRRTPDLQSWMQQVRDVLLGDRATVGARLPREVKVVRYDAERLGRVPAYGTPVRDLWQLDEALSAGFKDPAIVSMGVLLRRNEQLGVIEDRLCRRFVCRRLKTGDHTADWARSWIAGYAAAVTLEHHVTRLLDVARRVAPRREHLNDIARRVGPSGIDCSGLRQPRRALAEEFNRLGATSETLPDALAAAQVASRVACAGQEPRVVAWDALQVVRQSMRAPTSDTDEEAAKRAEAKLLQLRMVTAGHERRGISLLTCHEGKGQEFDLVAIPFLSTESFEDDEDSRQLLYVSLSRAKRCLFVRIPEKGVPQLAERIGLV